VGSIDFPKVFEVVKPLLPEEYRAWAIQGQGAVVGNRCFTDNFNPRLPSNRD